MNYIGNGYSDNMIKHIEEDVMIVRSRITKEDIPTDVVSCIGHEDLAKMTGYEYNRTNIVLNRGDVLYIAQIVTDRLAEGTTTLEKGTSVRYVKYEII